MIHSLAVLDNLNLLPEAQEKIQALFGPGVVFPEDTDPSVADLIQRTGTAEAILISPRVAITQPYLNACPTVRYIGVCGTSLARVDQDEVTKRGIVLTNVKNYGDEPAAEFIFMHLLMLLRGVGAYQWKEVPHELMGKSLGIIGFGVLGQTIANLALAYGMQVSYTSHHRKPDWENRGVHYADLETVLRSCEIICLSGPTDVGILGEQEFALLQPGTILIQASMGNVFDRAAFQRWIAQEGNFALFDYSAGEENYQAYKDIPRVVFPKIVAGHSSETKQRLGEKVVENLTTYQLP